MEQLHAWPHGLTICALMLASSFCLSDCSPAANQLASNEPAVCGGDFGMLEQMQYDYRGNAKPVSADVYAHC